MQTICLNHNIEEVKSSIGVCTFNHYMRLLCAIEPLEKQTRQEEVGSKRDFTEKTDEHVRK